MEQRKQLHVSMVSTLLDCPRRFDYRNHGQDMGTGTASIVGTAVDNTVVANLACKIDGRKPMTISQCEEMAEQYVIDAFANPEKIRFTKAERERKDQSKVRQYVIDKAVCLAGLHAQHVAPSINPQQVRFQFSLSLDSFLESRGILYDPIDLVGEMDILEAGVIRDTKTSEQVPSEEDAGPEGKYGMQLTGYSLAHQVLFGTIPEVVIDCLCYEPVKGKRGYREGNYYRLDATRTASDLGLFLDDVAWAVAKIASGKLEAKPDKMKCMMCDFKRICPESAFTPKA